MKEFGLKRNEFAPKVSLFVLRFYGPVNGVMSSTVSLPNHTFTGQANRHSGSVVERPLCDREVAGSIAVLQS